VTAAVKTSLPTGLLIAHHADLLSTLSNLTGAFTPEAAAQVASFGPAAWPALRAAGTSLLNTESAEWLAVLEAYGPAADTNVPNAALNENLCDRILRSASRYPLQWVLLAEASRSLLNTETPLRAGASSWFDE
jgi:hypothetical protein